MPLYHWEKEEGTELSVEKNEGESFKTFNEFISEIKKI
jgi:predicted enzyme involved in methoxymalonyl-ACP biosynthesis